MSNTRLIWSRSNCIWPTEVRADKSTRRIEKQTDRKDFMTRILEHRDSNQVSDIQIAAHASDFVLAGSETTATALSCITYNLLRAPHSLQKLQEEVRGAFKSYDEINSVSTTPLKYLHAVALEGLRIYPPLPFALPRVVPPNGDTVDGHFLPAGVSVCHLNLLHLLTLRPDHCFNQSRSRLP